MGRYNSLRITIILSLFLGAYACQESGIIELVDSDEDSIFFITDSYLDSYSRGTPVTDDNIESQLLDFGVFASLTIGEYEDSDDQSANFMYNQKVERDGEDWTYSPSMSWSSIEDSYTSFFAYAPYAVDDDNGIKIIDSEDGSIPKIKYEVPRTCKDQPDLMVATPQMNRRAEGGLVTLNMQHALATVAFSVKGSSDNPITDIKISNFVNEATLDFSGEEFVWEVDDEEITRRNYSINLEYGDEAEDGVTPVTAADGYLMMIPQSISDVTIEITLDGKDPQDLSFAQGATWEAGKRYNYVISFEEEEDTRIIDEIANCYMLDYTKYSEFYIPIDERINEFWREHSRLSSDEYGDYLIGEDDCDWEPVILWEYSEGSGITVERMEGTLPTNSGRVTPNKAPNFLPESCNAAFKVTCNATKGSNVLVGVIRKIDGEDVVLWSWHLWITDYNPDSVIHTPEEEVYIYNVTGGEIHRYVDNASQLGNMVPALWDEGGVYADSFIMDRNLGSMSPDPDVSSTYREYLYYQWGRKDPFPIEGYSYHCDYDFEVVDDAVELMTGVMTPTTFYCSLRSGSLYWCSDRRFSGNDYLKYLWHDVDAINPYYQAVEGSIAKSIFDPSPLGWCVPLNGVYSNFQNNFKDSTYDEYVHFPLTGKRERERGTMIDIGSKGQIWNVDPSSTVNSKSLKFEENQATPNSSSYRVTGNAIRCVRE